MKSATRAVDDGIRKDRELVEKLRTRISSAIGNVMNSEINMLTNAAEAVVRAGSLLDERERLNKEEVIAARAALKVSGLVPGAAMRGRK